jgi:hypothetical protein
VTAPRLSSHSILQLKGADAPNVWTLWHEHGTLSVTFDAGANQSIGLAGTPQELRLALAKGLAAIDRAVAEREVAVAKETSYPARTTCL